MKGNQKLSLNFPLESIPENYLDTQLEEKKTWMPEGNQKKKQITYDSNHIKSGTARIF